MPAKREPKSTQRTTRPAATPEARENQLIAAAVDLAEKQIRDGTASSQVVTHYLKLGSSREKLEQLKIEKELELNDKKMEALEAQTNLQAVYTDALEAMRSYTGSAPPMVVTQDDDYQD